MKAVNMEAGTMRDVFDQVDYALCATYLREAPRATVLSVISKVLAAQAVYGKAQRDFTSGLGQVQTWDDGFR